MIPQAHIISWRGVVPWPSDAQVEQDLVISRALVEIFNQDFLSQQLAFRGGTALHKLFIDDKSLLVPSILIHLYLFGFF